MGARCGNHEHVPGQWWTMCNHEFRLEPDVCLFQPPCSITSAIANRSRVFFTSPLGPCWARLGQVGPVFSPIAYLGPILGLCWPYLGPVLALCWPYVGLCWPHVGPSWGLCWGYVRYVRPSVERPPRCKFFLPGPLRRTKNNVKTKVFTFANKKHVLVQARKTP